MDTRRKGAKWRNPHGGEGTSKEGRRVLSYPWYFRDHDNPTDSNKVAEGIRRLEREREQEGRKEGRSVVTGWEKKMGEEKDRHAGGVIDKTSIKWKWMILKNFHSSKTNELNETSLKVHFMERVTVSRQINGIKIKLPRLDRTKERKILCSCNKSLIITPRLTLFRSEFQRGYGFIAPARRRKRNAIASFLFHSPPPRNGTFFFHNFCSSMFSYTTFKRSIFSLRRKMTVGKFIRVFFFALYLA